MMARRRGAAPRLGRALRLGAATLVPMALTAFAGEAQAQAAPPARTRSPAAAATIQQQTNQPVVLSADEVVYDRDLDVVTATGNVEIVQGNRVIRANTVSFNRRNNTVSASGNVSLLEPTGDVIFADHAELTEDLREGAIQNFRALLADWSRLAAVSGRRSDGNVSALRKVVYSPCELCKDDPTRAPLWQIKAARAVHDEKAATISYRDAWVEVGGVPIFYTPYLEHPDGTVRRKSGLLAPAFGTSSVLGQFFAQPYFQTLGPSADVTLYPFVYTEDNPMLAAEYRQRFNNGAVAMNGSVTYAHVYNNDNQRTGQETLRSHIAGTGRFDIDDDWRWGFDIARASHDTYLQRYKLFDRFRFIDRNTLTSRGFVEGFRGRSYATAQSFAFQGLREQDNSGDTPLVLPLLQYQYLTEPDRRGGYFSFDSYSYAIYRTEGTRSQRTAGVLGYTLPFTASTGEVWTLSGSVQGDLFNVTSVGSLNDGYNPPSTGLTTRVFPQVSLGWRWPLVRTDERFRTVVEPMLAVVAAPRLNQNKYPNEDSRAIDLDDTILFRRNRFAGFDRVDDGQRVDYGLRLDTRRLDTGARLAGFLGQSYSLQRDGNFPQESGLYDNASNIVGRLTVSPHEWVGATWQFQVNKDDLSWARNTAVLGLGPQALNFSIGYNFIDQAVQPSLSNNLEQIVSRLVGRIDENWRFLIRDERSVTKQVGQLRFNAALIYEDECFLFGVDFQRRFIGSRDDPPDTSLVFRVALRNLGEARLQGF